MYVIVRKPPHRSRILSNFFLRFFIFIMIDQLTCCISFALTFVCRSTNLGILHTAHSHRPTCYNPTRRAHPLIPHRQDFSTAPQTISVYVWTETRGERGDSVYRTPQNMSWCSGMSPCFIASGISNHTWNHERNEQRIHHLFIVETTALVVGWWWCITRCEMWLVRTSIRICLWG